MANVRYRLWGPSGARKTCTGLTGRGKQAVIDRDNQMWMYWRNSKMLPMFSPLATMQRDFSEPGPDGKPLVAGSPAVWLATDPARTTRDRVKEFGEAAGLGPGDQLLDDPFSALWELCVDAADIKFAQKGAKVDYYGLKHPTTTLMNWYKRAAYDVCFTAHQKAEWSKEENRPSDKVIPTGESQRTPRDIMWEFRLAIGDAGDCQMVVTKEKGMLFKVGEKFRNPVMREIFQARGVYQFAGEMAEPETAELDEAGADALFDSRAAEDGLASLMQLELDIRAAASAGTLQAFRDNVVNRRRVAALGPAQRAKVAKLVEELAKP